MLGQKEKTQFGSFTNEIGSFSTTNKTMRVRSYIQTLEDQLSTPTLLFDVNVPEKYDIGKDLHQDLFCSATHPDVHGKLCYTDGLILIDQQAKVTSPILLNFNFDSDMVVMELFLSGDRTIRHHVDNDARCQQLIQEKGHNLRFLKSRNYQYILGGNQNHDSFLLFLSVDFYFQLINLHVDIHKEFVESIQKAKETQLAATYLPMSHDIRTLISNVRACSRTGSLHRLCLQIKITELLMLQHEQQQQLLDPVVQIETISVLDEQPLEEAKTILEENFQNPPTIKQLALLVGINEFKLKSNFKKHYHSTIHDYVVSIRMKKAYRLIKDQKALIKETALEVGYQNPSHFSAVFRDFYGYNPTELV